MSLRLACCALALLLALPAARAADVYGEAAGPLTPDERIDLVFELGAGGRVTPAYEGSDEYLVSPFPIFSIEYLNIPGLVEIGGGPDRGLSIGPSFRYIGERNAGDFEELDGLDPIDATYEAGLRIGYEWDAAEVYGEARYAFGGAEGFIGGFGANLVARPSEFVELKAGPRATFASDDYMDTYFSVSTEEFVDSDGAFRPFDADGGFKSVGLAASARYEFRPDWFLDADASYERLVGDAGDSPIVDAGDENQYSFGLGLSRRFSVDLF